ncbi:MAG TPA: hypothetical protein VGM64_09560 [Lacunisphaera sp.]
MAKNPGFGVVALLFCASLVFFKLSPDLSAEPPHAGPAPVAGSFSFPALTDARKNEIRAEELFRRQVAKEIATGEEKGTSWWSVLNSSFALWFLSSVVVSGLTAAVALYQKKHSDEKQRKDLQTRLVTEISYRINNGLVAMHLDEKRVGAGNVYAQGAVYAEALDYLNNRVYSGARLLDFSIHQDYKTRQFLSLLFELRGSAGAVQRQPLRDADGEYSALEALADDAGIQNPAVDNASSLRAIAQSIQRLEKLRDNPAWKNLP